VPVYHGARFARDGVVAVTANYRLGVEGFLSLAGGQTNCGMRDQLAVLRWVQEEIAAFGGDPGNVTTCGQSAGAMCLDHLLSAPAARGLMHRAITQSGGRSLTLGREQGDRLAAALAERVGVPATRDALAAVDVEQTVAAQAALAGTVDLATASERAPAAGMVLFMPVRDGELVAADPATPPDAAIDLLLGDTSEEGNLYLVGTPGFDAMTLEQARGLVGLLHPDPGALLDSYLAERSEATPGELTCRALTDAVFHVPTVRLAEARAAADAPTHAYRFVWRSDALGGRLGACHAVDVPFAFDTLDTPGLAGEAGLLGPGGGPQELATRTHAAWVGFARDGDPGWGPYTRRRRTVMHIGSVWSAREDPGLESCAIWEGIM
jgi:para-nitrobenzyl esterase